ncbi:MAG: T9SS type A sorting domain-containing protein, partial [Bacteroidota bacterium]
AGGLGNELRGLQGITRDSLGNFYVCNQNCECIGKLTPQGVYSVFAGGDTAGGLRGFRDGIGTAAKFSSPKGLSTSPDGSLLVADVGNHAIRRISLSGEVSTVCGNDTAGDADGPIAVARLHNPLEAVEDKAGNIYITEFYRHTIRKLSNGIVSTFAGQTDFGDIDGQGTEAKFFRPKGMAFDSADNLYVADQGNNIIRKITPAGMVSTFAGRRRSSCSNCTGFISTSPLDSPEAITIDKEGNMYCVGYNSLYAYKLSNDGYIRSIAGTTRVAAPVEGRADSVHIGVANDIFAGDSGKLYLTEQLWGLIRELSPKPADAYIWSPEQAGAGRRLVTGVPGTYTLKTVYGTCTSGASLPVIVTVLQPEAAHIARSGNYIFASVSVIEYRWYLNDTLLEGQSTQYLGSPENGIYRVSYKAASGCWSELSEGFIVGIQVGIGSSNWLPDLQLVPNPAGNFIRIAGLNRKIEITIYNTCGQKVLGNYADADTQIDLQSLPTGVYDIQAEGRHLRLVKE